MYRILIRNLAVIVLIGLAAPPLFAQQQLTSIEPLVSDANLVQLQSDIELSLTNTSLEDALISIAEEANLKLMYSKALLPEEEQISLHEKSISLYDALWTVLDGSDLRFAISQNQLLVLMKNSEEEKMLTEKVIFQETITGQVTDEASGEALPGVNILVEGTSTGTSTNVDGEFELTVPSLNETLIVTYVGYQRQEIELDGRSEISISMQFDLIGGDEFVVVGYGVQKKSDITGSVTSVPMERLEMVPNLNISQALQGAVPGVMVQTSTAGAASDETLMIRGRNSILANNDPLVVVDGIVYNGALRDINTNDIEAIDILKDASAAAIYGSRGANGVILITTKEGVSNTLRVSYDGKYSMQTFTNLPDMMSGEEFYHYKTQRAPGSVSLSEMEVYNSGEWVDWMDITMRDGASQQHNLSLSGGSENTRYYISGSLLDVQGLHINDDYTRLTSRINIDSEVNEWLTLGTRSQLSYDDQSGRSPFSTSGEAHRLNPLTSAYNDQGDLTNYPWPEDIYFKNPLQSTIWEDLNESYQVVLNNYAIIEVPYVSNLSYKINTGITARFRDQSTYRNRDTAAGFEVDGSSNTARERWNNLIVENIISHHADIGNHFITSTGLFSYEKNSNSGHIVGASRYPHDFISLYSIGEAEQINPNYTFNEGVLFSQMLRLNYSYDSRYLLTLTGRRDGFSGFGNENKWGFFPSIAIGWNLANEDFFPWSDYFNELKPRISWGMSGNQAVGSYETMQRLGSANWLSNKTTQAGYIPTTIGVNDLGWETSTTLNFGVDFGLLQDRITGDINLYKTNTEDLLLNRRISPVHGISELTQNIGETENRGLELSLRSINIHTGSFRWSTSGNLALLQNKILSLYGELDDDGSEIDDVSNEWFIGHPIRVNYNYIIDGVWQLDEAEEAASWGSQPGFVKIRDINGDNRLSPEEDKQIIGQQDPKFMWGLTNTFSYENFNFSIFLHGVHGVTKDNPYLRDDVYPTVRRNTINKNWWTPENPTNEFYMNQINADRMDGVSVGDREVGFWYEDASFIRVKDITLSYTFQENTLGFRNLSLYTTGRNLYTFTKWSGLDPELERQDFIPLQREFVFGINFGF